MYFLLGSLATFQSDPSRVCGTRNGHRGRGQSGHLCCGKTVRGDDTGSVGEGDGERVRCGSIQGCAVAHDLLVAASLEGL